MSDFDPYRKWLGIAPKDQPPHHYRLLGVDLFESDPDVIESAADQRMTYLHSCAAGEQVELGEQLLDEVSAARIVLLDAHKKSRYDAELRSRLSAKPVSPPEAPNLRPSALAASSNPVPLQTLHSGTAQTRPGVPKSALFTWVAVAVGSIAIVTLLVFAVVTSGDSEGEENETEPQQELFSARPSDETLTIETTKRDANATGSPQDLSKSEDSPEQKQVATSAPESPTNVGFAVAPLNANQAKEVQVQAAERFGMPLEFHNSIGMRFRLVPPGEYLMGGVGAGNARGKAQRLRIDEPFYLSVYETTQYQYDQFKSYNPNGKGKTLANPVTKVTWHDAIDFCSQLTNLPDEQTHGRTYRLPTEAMWEFACRAGSTTKYSFGDDDEALGDYAWMDGNSEKVAHSVGTKLPNPWGFFDMHGNAWEWCQDWYHEVYSSYETPFKAGTDPGSPPRKVFRGGSFSCDESGCASATLWQIPPRHRGDDIGFRVVCMVPQKQSTGESSRKSETSRVESAVADRLRKSELDNSVDLLKTISPEVNQVVGDWRFEKGSLITPRKYWARLQVPYSPPQEYVLTARVSRIEGSGALGFGLVVGGRQVMLVFDSWKGDEVTAIEKVDGRLGASDFNPTRVIGRRFQGSTPHTVVCTIHKNEIQVEFDDETIVSWRGDPSQLSLHDKFRVPREDQLFLTSYAASFRIHSLVITPIQ